METFDVIVIGTGGVGSAVLLRLADRGVRVLGLDQFPPGHHHGSSHGQTRIIRQAYFEHSDYVPLLLRAYELWHDIETRAGQTLFQQVGLLEVGPADGVVIPGVMHSVQQHQLPIESLTPSESRQRFPAFSFPDDWQAVFEPTAGYLLVERCVEAQVRLAREAGAVWRRQRVVSWNADASGVTVETESGHYASSHLVVCAGAWSAQLLANLGVPLRVIAKHQYWFTPHPVEHDAGACPTFFFEVPAGYFYGFPPITEQGIKVARHSGGTLWKQPQPLAGVRDSADEAMVRHFVAKHLRGVAHAPVAQQACMYTMSPDEHFVVDRYPEQNQVVFAAGLSGHGFKFTPVLGEALTDLTLAGHSELPIGFLSLSRFL